MQLSMSLLDLKAEERKTYLKAGSGRGDSRPNPAAVRMTGILAGAGGWNRVRKFGRERTGSGACRWPGVGQSYLCACEREGVSGREPESVVEILDMGINRGQCRAADWNQAGLGSIAACLCRRGKTGWGGGMSSEQLDTIPTTPAQSPFQAIWVGGSGGRVLGGRGGHHQGPLPPPTHTSPTPRDTCVEGGRLQRCANCRCCGRAG